MVDVGQQGVHDDVEKLAAYFVNTYRTLEAAASAIDHDTEWDIPQFRAELKRWGVLVADPDELFYHIDADYSGRISFLELYAVLSQPVAEVKVREERRQSAEVTAIYEELAEKIRDFGGVEDAFKAVGAVGGLSIAQFRQLLKKVHMELSHAQVTRVFQRLDADNTKTVSMQELRNALGYYLVRGTLVDLAAHLSESSGSVAAAFDSNRAERRPSFLGGPHPDGLPPSLPVSPLNASTGSAMLPLDSLMPMNEKEFLTLLRRLKVLVEGSMTSFLKTDSAVFLFSQLQGPSFTAEDFKLRLEKVHEEERKMREDAEQQRARTEQMKKRRAFTELPGVGGVVARGRQAAWQTGCRAEVDAWTAAAAKAGSQMRPEEVTRMWEIDARSGKSRAQLQDYKALLEHQISQRQTGPGSLQELQEEVAGRWDGLHEWDLSPPISPATPSLNAFSMSGRLRRDKRVATVGQSEFLDQSRGQQQAAVKSKRLIQASAVGDVAGLQSVLNSRVDVNIAGWGGVTPLMTAARHGREAALQTLLAAHADIGRTDSHGRTAVDHARQAPMSLRSRVSSRLTGHGGLSGQELKSQVDALARRVLDIEAECLRLNHYKGKLPSREEINENKALLKRMETRKGLARTASRGLGDQTPRSARSARSTRSQWDEDIPSFGLPGGFGAGGAGLGRDAAIMRGLMGDGAGLGHDASIMRSLMGDGAGADDVFTTAGFPHKPPLLPIPGVAGESRRW